ncbi:type II secretion system F family protein [Murimonas intestini]|uniref:Type IV pilus assembly protein PilC n=1 Tax=Murimonas intestini TaxID=1337051 RepID=A0AB73T0U2_9FIRM|nr:type II secretion system F family protein [Murimonas intestini]MCR1840149.1 type II secretion system F family protein [Murimonas intestini]MCR1867601.1 type II secretion system F family protein [Murimonas intestini]MCR1884984.1 type II secretion system F family protein [Murimonas intestini]
MASNEKIKMLSNTELSAFCDQMAMILRSGISAAEGITILKEDAATPEAAGIFGMIETELEETGQLHLAIKAAKVFPKYLLDMAEIGESSGKLDEVMASLAKYYEREENITKGIKNAVTYPFVMIAMMVVIILILIIKVMPIFNQVFIQLGSEMTGFSRGVLNLGSVLSRYSVVFIAVLAVLAGLLIYCIKSRRGRASFRALAARLPFTRKLFASIASGRFASGMALTLSSGLDMDESLAMTARLVDNPVMEEKIRRCQQLIAEGTNFSDALLKSDIFTGIYSKMVSVGFKTGSADEIMQKVADQYEAEVDGRIDHLIGILEPSLVAVLSILVGMILLSVMLPLLGIMSGISAF